LAQNPNAQTARAVLEEFPERYAEVEKVVAAEPALQKAIAADVKIAKEKAKTQSAVSPATKVADPDSDGDGSPDPSDGCPQDKNKTAPGSCGCGKPDTDTDGDGTPDCADGCPQDKNKTAPGSCGCGKPNTDTDGDGTPDCADDCPGQKGSAARKGCPDPSPANGNNPPEEQKHGRRSGLETVPVPGGSCMMGSPDSDQGAGTDEKPQHKVTLSTFQMGKYEVTQADWREIMGSNPKELNFKGCDQCPVEGVSWEEIQDFLKKLRQKYPDKKYRLPTEAEWEYAARGGAGARRTTYAGSDELATVAWYDGNSGRKTHPVGEKAPNGLGLYDMSGNVYEWCSDWYDEGYYKNSPAKDPVGPASGDRRVLRGGSWYADPEFCRASYRSRHKADYRFVYFGFRVARGY